MLTGTPITKKFIKLDTLTVPITDSSTTRLTPSTSMTSYVG